MIGKKVSKFYDADCMPCLDTEIKFQDYDTDELEKLSEDEKPEDYTDLLPVDNAKANADSVDNIHKTMDRVIKMYKTINSELNNNSEIVTDFLDKLEK